MVNHYVIKAETFFLDNGVQKGGYLEVNGDVFGQYYRELPDTNLPVIDFGEHIVAPGLFDTHIHGVSGHDVMDNSIEAIENISKNILRYGVTRFLPTTLTSSFEKLKSVVKTIYEANVKGDLGAKIEGIFLEGPYFTETHKGAQNPSYFKDPSIEELDEWIKESNGLVRKIALAPERNGAPQFIKDATNKGVFVALAHTDADYETCIKAIESGASIFVHLFNGMKGLHHREPGTVGAALSTKDTFVELIVDGEHVHPAAINITVNSKEKDKVCLITDCMRAGLMPDGKFLLGEFEVHVQDGIARTSSGSLAGSTLKLIDGVRNLHKWTHLSFYECWKMASSNPAASVGLSDKFGSIKENNKADFVVISQDGQIEKVAVEGKIKYERNEEIR